MGHLPDARCSRCGCEDANSMLFAWDLLGVAGFWSNIYTCLKEVASHWVPWTPLVAVIGYVNDVLSGTCQLMVMLLSLPKRMLAMHWEHHGCPECKDWLVDVALMQERLKEYRELMPEKNCPKDICASFVADAARHVPWGNSIRVT
ncbi:hypothetical protein NDU88_006502 [Pleurodeles waltl]|uniref:Uncharacterized protein n=1 Tax=Pleurodeles waltl TaxID=8319 RepID=A0AAV7LPT4_PLEWA|nr:hypothetical protein NDU88_006502 [Pleurodeles waltl]